MPTIYVCSLSSLHQIVETSKASHLVSLIHASSTIERPISIARAHHLSLGVSDITEIMDGHVLPGHEHVEKLLEFVRDWNRQHPLVIHCLAGISRSTAAAYIAACALASHRSEDELAQTLRRLSPSATPNPRLVAVADDILKRRGRMKAAVASIGRGADAYEGKPFAMTLD